MPIGESLGEASGASGLPVQDDHATPADPCPFGSEDPLI